MDLKLFIMEQCPFCKKVMREIENLDIKDKMEIVDINEDEEAEKELIEVGGQRQVPCIFIDGKPMYESNDIIEFLRENFS